MGQTCPDLGVLPVTGRPALLGSREPLQATDTPPLPAAGWDRTNSDMSLQLTETQLGLTDTISRLISLCSHVCHHHFPSQHFHCHSWLWPSAGWLVSYSCLCFITSCGFLLFHLMMKCGAPSVIISLRIFPGAILLHSLRELPPQHWHQNASLWPRPLPGPAFLLQPFQNKHQSMGWHVKMLVRDLWWLAWFYWSQAHMCCQSVSSCFISHTFISWGLLGSLREKYKDFSVSLTSGRYAPSQFSRIFYEVWLLLSSWFPRNSLFP